MAQLTNGASILPNAFGEFIAPNYNHVTVVQVEESEPKNGFDDDFVTVLQVGDEGNGSIEEEIIIYRLPGERLGMALKFEGGLNANEKINKVFIQSINTESPASKVRGQHLEYLREGDQIMEIDGRSTTTMTRLECIGLLRDAQCMIKVSVRRDSACQCLHSSLHIPNNSLNSGSNQSEAPNHCLAKVNSWPKKVPPPVPPRMATTILSSKRKSAHNCQTRSDSDCDGVEKPPRKKLSQPPPLPPRRPKVPPPKPPNPKTLTFEPKSDNINVNITENELNVNVVESDLSDQLPEEVTETKSGQEKQTEEQMEYKLSFSEPTLPSEPDVYLDLLTNEDRLLIESESDDTGSSVSTIIERFSRTSTANSSFSDHISRKTPTIDIVGRVLSPFEKLERELDHKEALQAFVNKAASVLMADEDLRQITEESLCDVKSFDVNIDNYCETSSRDLSDKQFVNLNEIVSNVQILVPPEEFSTQIDSNESDFLINSLIDLSEVTEPTKELLDSEKCFEELDLFSLKSKEDNDSIDKEIELIDKILNEVENEQKSHQNMIFELEFEIEKKEDIIEPEVTLNQLDSDLNDITITLIEPPMKDIQCEENEVEIEDMISNKDIKSEFQSDFVTNSVEQNKKIENNIELDVKNKDLIDIKEENKSKSNANNINENFNDFDNEIDLFEDIDDLNREIEALEELVEYEIKLESLKESQNSKSVTKSELKFNGKTDSNEEISDKSRVLSDNSVHSYNNSNTNNSKYSPPLVSLIPRRLPTVTPRKSKSYGNLPALYAAYKTPDKKPSLIPRPVSTVKINTVINSKTESPKQTNSHNSIRVQKSKTRILSERKKNEVLNSNSIKNKRTVNQKPEKSVLKCKSLMDLTAAFSLADSRNGANDSEESNECLHNNRPQTQCLVLTETNQTESSLQSKKSEDNNSGTESESQIDLKDNHQKDIIESVVNQQTLITDNTTPDISDQIRDDSIEENSVKITVSEQCVDEIQKEDIKEEKTEEQLNQNMIGMRKVHELMDSSTRLPPTCARQPPDGREITLNCMDLDSTNGINANIPPLSCEVFQMQGSVHEDSGVFINADTPSPELDFNSTSISRGGVPTVAVTRIKYKSNGDNCSDADTGITSMSSDSMDELDSCPIPNYKLKKQIIDKSRLPSSDFLSETATNGFTSNGTNNSNKCFDISKSVRERIAMFDIQRSDSSEDNDDIKESIKALPKSDTSFKGESPLTERLLNSKTSASNGKNDLMSESFSTTDKSELIADKLYRDKSIDSLNDFVYNTKSSFMHKKSMSLTSDNPSNQSNSQQNSTNLQYSGHLQPSYVRYSSLGSPNDSSLHSNSYSGIGVHKPLLNGSLLSSILETRKQNASKLKGLIIPDIPTTTYPGVSKTLPTIFSNTSTSSTLLTSKPEEVSALTAKNVTQSQSQSQPNITSNYTLLSEPPWVSNNSSVPKYSPAFKRRQLELPRSLSLLNNVSQDSTDSFAPTFSRSNSMTTMSGNESQFQFSLSHSKPVIPLMPETAIGSPNIDGIKNTTNTPSIEEQLALSFNDSYRHSSIQRRYSADVYNQNNSLKFSLEKRSSADSSMNIIYKPPMTQLTQNEIISNQSLERSPVLNNKIYNSMTFLESKTKPLITERKSISTNNKVLENDYSIHKNIFNYNSISVQNLNLNNKSEDNYHNSSDKLFTRNLINSDYSDDDSSTISHKTSEDSSLRADDSASDTTSDSLDHTFSPDLMRPKVLGTQLTVLKNPIESEKISIKNDCNSESIKNFRALVQHWSSGTDNGSQNSKILPPPLPPKPSASSSRMPPSLMPRTKKPIPNTESICIDTQKTNDLTFSSNFSNEIKQLENTVKELELNSEFNLSKDVGSDSLSSDSSSDQSIKNPNNSNTSISRSVSDICKVFESNGNESSSSSKSTKSTSGLTSIKNMSDFENKVEVEVDVEVDDNVKVEGDVEVDIEADVEADVEVDVDIDIEVDIEVDVEVDVEVNAEVEAKDKTEIEAEVDAEEVPQKVQTPSETKSDFNEDKSLDEIDVENENNKSIYSDEKTTVWDKIRDNDDSVLTNHQRMSSIDSLASDSGASSSGTVPAVRSLEMRTSSASNLRDSLYGSVSSLASSTSIISPQELQQLIEEANQSLENNDSNSHTIQVVVLHREYKTSGSIGITLAGGSDCETKEITVHRVINGSLTDRDGRIKKGDRILSINGKILKGVSHKEALDIMKAPRPEVVIVLSRVNLSSNSENGFHSRQSSSDLNDSTNGTSNSFNSFSDDIMSSIPLSLNKDLENNLDSNYKILRAELHKDVAGVGFILEGGKDSPLGDRPLLIKRIFRGGPADKEGTLAAGDELITVNEHSIGNMTRTEAWNFLKKVPEGPVVLVVKRKKY